MKFNPDKYKYFIHQSKEHGSAQVTAVSTYAGHTVKGYAKCDPKDEFNQEQGMNLAAARCNLKVAHLRNKRAQRKYKEAQAKLAEAQSYLTKMANYAVDSRDAVKQAESEVQDILATM